MKRASGVVARLGIDLRALADALRDDPEAARELARVLAPHVFGIAAGLDAEPPIYTTEPRGPRPREFADHHRAWRDLVPRIPGATPLGKRWLSLKREDYERWRASQAAAPSPPTAAEPPDPPWRVGQAAEDLGFRPLRKAAGR